MDVREINHVEIHAGDAIQAAQYYRYAFGFRVVTEAGPEAGLPRRLSTNARPSPSGTTSTEAAAMRSACAPTRSRSTASACDRGSGWTCRTAT